MASLNNLRRRVLLIILDGFGVNPGKLNNAVHLANTPRLDEYFAHHPHTVLDASGAAVGLPAGQMGNSEVGHMIIGSGMIVRQDLVRINDSIKDGSFFYNSALVQAINRAQDAGKPLHLLGMVSDGGVHSHVRHLELLIDMCRRHGVKPVIHMITDGRDTPPRSAEKFLERIESKLELAKGEIATVMGRYYAMDRDNRWKRTETAWRGLVHLEGDKAANVRDAIRQSYEAGRDDEFIRPVILPNASPIRPDDSVIFFNFRNDRPRQLTKALADVSFNEFDRGGYEPAKVVTMTEFDASFDFCPTAFVPDRPEVTLSRVISDHGLEQFHCAETEKYPHVTFFLNGGRELPYPGETRRMIPSPDVDTYDLQPEMSAAEVADEVINALNEDRYAFMVVNFANGDMVGHTAIPDAVIKAVEVLDQEVGRVLDAAVENNYSVVLTADHGNCDEMVDVITDQPHTQHTLYPVPCLVIDKVPWYLASGEGLSSIAPTVLKLMGLPLPEVMTGESLLLQEAGAVE